MQRPRYRDQGRSTPSAGVTEHSGGPTIVAEEERDRDSGILVAELSASSAHPMAGLCAYSINIGAAFPANVGC